MSGFIVAGYGLAAFFFNFVAKAVVNPDNMKPDVIVVEDGAIIKYYSEEVANNVPKLFQILAACWVTMQFIAILIIKVPDEMIKKEPYLKNTDTKILEQHIEVNNNGTVPQNGKILITPTKRETKKDFPPLNTEENVPKKNLKTKQIECSNPDLNENLMINFDTQNIRKENHEVHDLTTVSMDHNYSKIGRYIKKKYD